MGQDLEQIEGANLGDVNVTYVQLSCIQQGIKLGGFVMGIDIVLYDKKGQRIGHTEIEYKFHEALFFRNNNWGSYHHLRKLCDFYLTDIKYNREEINKLIEDLKNIRMFIPKDYQDQVDDLILQLEPQAVDKIHCAGD